MRRCVALNRGQPSHAAKSRPRRNVWAGGARAVRAAAVTAPIPGMVISRRATALSFACRAILSVEHGDALIEGLQLLHQDAQDHASSMRQIGRGIVHEGDELGHMKGPFGRNDAELSQMASSRVDGLCALAN